MNRFLNKKLIFGLIFLGFSIFWFWDFAHTFFYMIVFPITFYIQQKNKFNLDDIAKNHSYIAFAATTIVISYIIFSLHYLSIQNPNKVFDKKNLVVETYYIPEYKSVRTRSNSQLLVENGSNREVINCSVIQYGRCPHAYNYGNNIDIGFVKIRKNFYRAISGRDEPRIAYYIKFGNEVKPSEYFVKKYDDEIKWIYLFLISLNLYMVFLYYVKISYGINLRRSFYYVFSNLNEIINWLLVTSILVMYPIFFVFL